MGDLSFAAPAHTIITEDGISTHWLAEIGESGAYILTLGRDPHDSGSVKLFLCAPIARMVIESLTAAMVAHSDLLEAAKTAIDDAVASAAVAEERQWAELGADAKAVQA